jgi:ABC-2 type transport system permease protein
MYGGFQGLVTVAYLQANLSPMGARRTVAPARRWRVVIYDLFGALTVHLLCIVTVVAYITFALGTSFGSQIWAVLLTCLAGSLLGIAFGAMVSAMSRMKEAIKVAILITTTMVCSFLAGLMVEGINYIVAQNAPIISWLNPAARIADAFYCLYFYDTYERYFLNIGIILGFVVIMFLLTAVFIRRQRYENI